MKIIKRALPLISLFIFSVALWSLHHTFSGISIKEVRFALSDIPFWGVLFSCLAVIANHAVLALNDGLALRYNGAVLSKKRVGLTAFLGNAISFSLGMSGLSGASVRYRLYSSFGLSPLQIAGVVAFCQTTTLLGMTGISGLILLLEPHAVLAQLPWGGTFRLGIALLLLAIPTAALLLSLFGKTVSVKGHSVHLPPLKVMGGQFLIATADLMLAAAVLYFLLPRSDLHFFVFFGIYILSILLGALSQVPGGAGVLDASLIWWLSPYFIKAELVGAILLYRLIYYVLPLIIAVSLLVFIELSEKTERYVKDLSRLIPSSLAILVFFVGSLLLVSGSLPISHERNFTFLKVFLPLSLLEASNFLNSLLGTLLLFLAWGLGKRLRSAWKVGALTLSLSVVISLLNAFHYQEAITALFLLVLLVASKKHFYRLSYFSRPVSSAHADVLPFNKRAFNYRWVASICFVLFATLWLGFFVHRHVEYSNALWWQFAVWEDAPRFLRAVLGMFLLSVFAFLFLWIQPYPIQQIYSPDSDEVRSLIRKSRDSAAALALLGDKKFFFSADWQAAVMYASVGGYWISMGDPIGSDESIPDAIWQFCEEADRCGAKPVFYEASSRWKDIYEDADLHTAPLGETADVDLEPLTEALEGSQWKGVRSIRRHMEQDGALFRIVENDERDALLPRLREISDQWLLSKQGSEKGFSLGFFDEGYLKNFPIAVVEYDGTVQAFCNLWQGGTGENLSVDLMRYSESAPRDIMSFLFIECMLWGKSKGYKTFSLGMAPLSGMHGQNSLWEHLGEIAYHHGESFYNFQGLRTYKEKFHPNWSSCYLAYPEGRDIPVLLPELVYLISHKRR